MSVVRGLYDYLTQTEVLTGHAALPFASSQTVGRHVVTDRNEAREVLRSIVGNRIYQDRRPTGIDHTSIAIRTADEDYDYGLNGEALGVDEALVVTIYARGPQARDRRDVAAKLFQLAVSGYHGAWGTHNIDACLVESVTTRAEEPDDGSDNWTMIKTIDLSVMHDDAAPIYPHTPLSAIFSFGANPGEGDDLRLDSTATRIPEGYTLTDCEWIVRNGLLDSSPIAVQFNGVPSATVVEANIGGTYRQPALDRVANSLGADLNVTLTVTDSQGNTSTFKGNQDG